MTFDHSPEPRAKHEERRGVSGRLLSTFARKRKRKKRKRKNRKTNLLIFRLLVVVNLCKEKKIPSEMEVAPL